MMGTKQIPQGAYRLTDYQGAFAQALRTVELDDAQVQAVDHALRKVLWSPETAAVTRPEGLTGIAPERLQLYRELLFHNISSFIDNAFPVLMTVLDAEQTECLKRAYFAEYPAHSPYFHEISYGFLDFLQGSPETLHLLPPFTLELAYYERLELALDVATDTVDEANLRPAQDWLKEVPVVTPLLEANFYQYPVHRIGPDFIPESPEPAWLLVYRDRSDQVGFMQINRATGLLLEALAEHPERTGAEQLQALAAPLGLPVRVLFDFAPELFDRLAARDIVLGVQRTP